MPDALLVDDDADFVLALAEVAGREGFATRTASTLAETRREMKKSLPAVVFVDLNLPDGSGLELFEDFGESPAPEMVFITGEASVDTAVEAMRKGASDYLVKPLDMDRVRAVLAAVSRTRELKKEVGHLRSALRQLGRFGPLVGGSPPMQGLYDLVERVARTQATVLIDGETGTGKELVAEAVHASSRRHKAPFLPLNCGAMPSELIASELFGHEKGSFTGADRLHKGYFERAHGGTLFLDEITEMSIEVQSNLLRVLETGQVTRVGGSNPIAVDVRIVAATNRRPEEAVAEGKLREDLHYRLAVFPIHVPPLRERGDDIGRLAQHFLAALNAQNGTQKELSKAALDQLGAHDWPGNVRELKNAVERAYILAEEQIGASALPIGGARVPRPSSNLDVKAGTRLDEVERRLILATMDDCEGNRGAAAEILGVSRKTLDAKLGRYKSA